MNMESPIEPEHARQIITEGVHSMKEFALQVAIMNHWNKAKDLSLSHNDLAKAWITSGMSAGYGKLKDTDPDYSIDIAEQSELDGLLSRIEELAGEGN